MRLLVLFSVFISWNAFAGVLSPSSQEVRFNYTAEFQTSQAGRAVDLADSHAQHIFGYFQSPTVTSHFGIDSSTIGIGAPKMPLSYEILSDKRSKGLRTISYKVTGVMLLNRLAAVQLINDKQWTIQLPYDLDNFYVEKCTDEHYNTIGDFWYFYDPFRKGCESLRTEPMAREVVMKVAAVATVKDTSAGFAALRGDNGNGDVFEIATVNGFSDNSSSSEDLGRQNYQEINQWLVTQGFEEKTLARYQDRPVMQYTKSLKTAEGKVIQVRITRLLANTEIGAKNVTFAKFFKNAMEKADVVIYNGHSGLGGNLDIASLEEKAGKINFDPKKRQLFFFDSCSSYSYYLGMFESQKSKGKIDVITEGLQSYFWAEVPTLKVLFKNLFDVKKDPNWSEVLGQMERVLGGQTQMLNVGSI